MSIAPETAVSPVAQAPPDRPTTTLEDWARQGLALLFGDRKLDPQEQEILRGFMEEVAMRAQAGGGIGMGGTPSPDAGGAQAPMSPMEMNANTQDFGDGQGEPTGEEY
jgi:hypothetical protein